MVADGLVLPFTDDATGEASYRGVAIVFQMSLLVTMGAEVIIVKDDGVVNCVSNG